VLLHLTDARVARVGWRLQGEKPFSVALPERTLALAPRTWQMCLILADGALIWDDESETLIRRQDSSASRSIVAVARIRGSARPTSTDDRVMVAEPNLLDEPVTAQDLLAELPAPLRREVRQATRSVAVELPGPTGDAVVEALVRLRPGIGATVRRLRREDLDDRPVSGSEGEILVLERDAVRLAMSIAGVDAEPLQEWTGSSPADGFLPNLAYEAHEDVLLAYDAARFAGLTALPSERPDWILFGDGRNHIRVASVNNTPLEQTLGVDLIYRHIEADAFVLVQYKRMTRDGRSRWFYRPDRELDEQLQQMRTINDAATTGAGSPATWRLHPNGFVLKLVRQPVVFDPGGDRLLPGLYLPLEYLDELLADPSTLTERRARRLGYDTVDRYLTSDLFVALVRHGWIGTRGVTTGAVALIAEAALGSGRSVMLAEEWGQQPGLERRRRPDRR